MSGCRSIGRWTSELHKMATKTAFFSSHLAATSLNGVMFVTLRIYIILKI